MIRVLENNFSSQYRMHNCKKASLEGIKLIQVPNNGFWIEVVSVRIVKGILEVETTELCGKYDIGVRWKKDVVFKFCVWLIKCNIMVFFKKNCICKYEDYFRRSDNDFKFLSCCIWAFL